MGLQLDDENVSNEINIDEVNEQKKSPRKKKHVMPRYRLILSKIVLTHLVFELAHECRKSYKIHIFLLVKSMLDYC